MTRQYQFCLDAIKQGRTVLVYKGVTASKAKHVKTADRVALIGQTLFIDGQSAKGMTICLKP